MGIQPLTKLERKIRAWRIKRGKVAQKLMRENPRLTTYQAFRLAAKQIGPMP